MPVVYLHPVGLDGEMWESVATAGALIPSFPGFGRTPLSSQPTFEYLVDFVAGIVADGGPADLVGVSLGSMVAQHVVLRRPELVRSIVLACGGMATDPSAMRERAAMTRRLGMDGIVQMTLRRWFTAAAVGTEGHPGVSYARDRLLSDSAEVFASYWEAMAEHDVSEELRHITVPATVVAGTNDAAVSVSAMQAMAERIPGAHFTMIDGPHMLPLENPDGFANVVCDHLTRNSQ